MFQTLVSNSGFKLRLSEKQANSYSGQADLFIFLVIIDEILLNVQFFDQLRFYQMEF